MTDSSPQSHLRDKLYAHLEQIYPQRELSRLVELLIELIQLLKLLLLGLLLLFQQGNCLIGRFRISNI